jgi:hypothetical protein
MIKVTESKREFCLSCSSKTPARCFEIRFGDPKIANVSVSTVCILCLKELFGEILPFIEGEVIPSESLSSKEAITMAKTPVQDVIAIVCDLEDQDHFSEIASAVTQGFITFQHIDAGMAVLSKEPLELTYADKHSIIDTSRFSKSGSNYSLLTEAGLTLTVHKHIIKV